LRRTRLRQSGDVTDCLVGDDLRRTDHAAALILLRGHVDPRHPRGFAHRRSSNVPHYRRISDA
jgi:hypothetical protein